MIGKLLGKLLCKLGHHRLMCVRPVVYPRMIWAVCTRSQCKHTVPFPPMPDLPIRQKPPEGP